MLLINETGRIFEVPEQVAEKYVVTNWKTSKEAVGDMLSALRSQPSVSSEAVQADCCQLYANYCPNR